MKVQFGKCEVNENGITLQHNYTIEGFRLWETKEFNGVKIWDWLIHLTEKNWMSDSDIMDLNTAFFFAQDYFKVQFPERIREASTFQTLYVQKQYLERRAERKKNRNDNESGFVRLDLEKVRERREKERPIQLL